MNRVAGDGLARPKRPLPSGSAPRHAADSSSSRPAAGVAGAPPRSSRGEALRPARSPEFYLGISLRLLPPPRDPARDPHLLLPVTLAPEQVLPQGVVIPADLIQAKLTAYIGDFRGSDFAWEVTEMAPLVFSVPFPSAELLRVFSHDFIRCPMNKFQISAHAAATEPDPVSPLEKVWVLVYGLPRGGRSAARGVKLAHILKAISKPVGKQVTADLVSFEDDGPARIEILCPAPSKIDGMSLRFYFGTKGRRLTFELESPVPEERLRPAPSASVPRDEGQDGDGGLCGESSFCEEDDGDVGVPSARYDGRHSPGSTGGGSSGQAGLTSQVASGVVAVVMAGPPPVATTAADLEIVEADVLSVRMEVCPSSSPRSCGGGLLLALVGVPLFSSLRVPGSGAAAALGPSHDGCDPCGSRPQGSGWGIFIGVSALECESQLVSAPPRWSCPYDPGEGHPARGCSRPVPR
ncbi:hypothetical protein ZWY2020_000696 [Hordeum vulgare]|nr:hypothetical protein ZWY2020_000696 [Hordeum vulgare]